jgi:hypothetical protein
MRNVAVILLVLLARFAAAQTFVKDLQADLRNFYDQSTPLKIGIFTNQPSYAAGDTIFYKINLLTAQRLKPVAGRSILTVLFFDGAGKNVSSQYVSVKDGFGSNQLVIPPTVAPGIYCLKIFNGWMLNGPSDLIFTKFVNVGVAGISGGEEKLEIHPEGNVIEGVSSRFVTTGKPFESLVLITASGNELLNFASDKDGYAEFVLTPAPATKYVIKTAAGQEFFLPEAVADGVSVHVQTTASELKAVVTVPPRSKYKDQTLHLVLSVQGEIVYAADVRIKSSSQLSVNIKTENLLPGTGQLTIFNDERNVLAERLVYIRPKKLRAEIRFDKEIYSTRDKVKCAVRLLDDKGNALPSSYSATVFNNDLTPADESEATIESQLLLQSDIGFTGENCADSLLIDRKLVASTWRRFNWDSIRQGKPPVYSYNQNLRFSGRAIEENTGKPVRDSTLISFFLQKSVVTYQAYTNPEGKFDVLMLLDFYDEDEIFYKAEYKGKVDKNIKVILDPAFDAAQINVAVASGAAAGPQLNYGLFSRQKSVINNSYFYYNESSSYLKTFKARTSIVEEVYGPDLGVNLKDYLLFPTMSETLREIVPLVQHRKVRGVDVISVYNLEAKFFPESEPVFVIDGVMTDDVGYFLGLAPADVISIKILYTEKKVKGFGPIGNGGIIVVDTKLPNNFLHVPRSRFSLNVQGLNKPASPLVESRRDERTPDLRTTLCWLPFVDTNKDGTKNFSFTTSDIPGTYVLRIEGLTYDGHPYSFTKDFQVKFTPPGK